MALFKFLIGLSFLSSAVVAAEGDGWISVEKVPKTEEAITDVDSSIWILFFKKIGSQKFSVRLPSDPVYRATEGGFCLRSIRGGEIFELAVQKRISDAIEGDFFFELDGKWVHEHIVQIEGHTFRLRTFSPIPESPNHDSFVASFSVYS